MVLPQHCLHVYPQLVAAVDFELFYIQGQFPTVHVLVLMSGFIGL